MNHILHILLTYYLSEARTVLVFFKHKAAIFNENYFAQNNTCVREREKCYLLSEY